MYFGILHKKAEKFSSLWRSFIRLIHSMKPRKIMEMRPKLMFRCYWIIRKRNYRIREPNDDINRSSRHSFWTPKAYSCTCGGTLLQIYMQYICFAIEYFWLGLSIIFELHMTGLHMQRYDRIKSWHFYDVEKLKKHKNNWFKNISTDVAQRNAVIWLACYTFWYRKD